MSWIPQPLCSYTTFSGQPCRRVGVEETPAGRRWCGVPHERGTKKDSGGQNGPCSCGSGVKHKRCCARLPEGAQPNIYVYTEEPEVKPAGSMVKVSKNRKVVWSVGYNWRRWVFGYERDAQWKANVLYLGPLYISRRSSRPQ